MQKHFRGCLIGAVLGDCLGAPFELGHGDLINMERILKVISPQAIKDKKKFKFTDDTAMTRSVCASLLAKNSFDAEDMAARFTEEYRKEPGRGYGGVTSIFDHWHEVGVQSDVYKPAREQFGGAGSYGNGAAMRVAPVALFCSEDSYVIEMAKKQALLTHTAKHGYNGAILEALAVFKALRCATPVNSELFIDDLICTMSKIELVTLEPLNAKFENEVTSEEGNRIKGNSKIETQIKMETGIEPRSKNQCVEPVKWSRSSDFSFVKQLHLMKDLLKEKDVSTRRVVDTLGHDITAQEAVPAAIYCFLRNSQKDLKETIYYAISLGGDTDTIATMAGAIAGAYFTAEGIPTKWLQACEGIDDAVSFADQFYRLHEQRSEKV